MNEKLAEFLQKLGKNIDRVAIIVFLLLLIGAGFLFMQERAYQAPVEPDRPRREWSVKIPRPADLPAEETSDYEKVRASVLDVTPDINQDDEMRRLITINMFDIKSVRSETERAQEIQRDYDRALKLFEERNYEEARRIVETILRRNPDHSRTLRLRENIERAMAPTAPEATPEPTTPEEGTEAAPPS